MSRNKGLVLIACLSLMACLREKQPKHHVQRLASGSEFNFVRTNTERGYFEVIVFQPANNRHKEGSKQLEEEIWSHFTPQADAGGWTYGELTMLDNETYRTFPKESLSSVGLIEHVRFSKNKEGQWVKQSGRFFSSGFFD